MKVKQPRKLTRPNTQVLPKHLIFFDTETKKTVDGELEYHEFDIGWTAYRYRKTATEYTKPKYRLHSNALELAQYIESKAYGNSKLWVLAHNVFFDMQVSGFFEHFRLFGYTVQFFYDKGLTFILSINNNGKTIVFLSTTNYFGFALSKLGEYVNLPKMEIDFDKSSRESLIAYCKRDVEIIDSAFLNYIQFLVDNNFGSVCYTRASQAMTAYRHRFMTYDIVIHRNDELSAFEKLCYYGGRTEAFKIGEMPADNYISLDINSMYPFVMKNKKCPTKYVGKIEDTRIENIERYLEHFGICAHVEIDTDEPAYAVRYNNKIIFPVGNFETYLCTAGLDYAVKKGHIKRIIRAEMYEMENIFTAYVNCLYELKTKNKNQGNELYTQITKIMLNSLYGKFGQHKTEIKREVEETGNPYYKMDIYDHVTDTIINVTKFLNTIIIENDAEVSDKSFIAIAAHITEYARMLLWDIINSIGRQYVYYCDTDSVKIRKSDLRRVKHQINPVELGALGIDDEFTRFIINGAKDYETDNMIKMKGIPKNAVKNDRGNYEYSQFCGMKTHLRMKEENRFVVRHIEKIRRRFYDKSYVYEDGTTAPFQFKNNILIEDIK